MMLELIGYGLLVVLAFIGIVSMALLLLFFVFNGIYNRRKKAIREVPAAVSPDEMPLMRPLPLNSRNQTNFNRLLVYLYVPREWELLQDWQWVYTDPENNRVKLVVPRKFRCDVASIPRPFRALFNPSGLLLLPALLHDYAFKYNFLWQIDSEGQLVQYDPPDFGSEAENLVRQKIFWDDLLFEAGMQINGSLLVNKIIRILGRLGLSKKTWLEYRQAGAEANRDNFLGESCRQHP